MEAVLDMWFGDTVASEHCKESFVNQSCRIPNFTNEIE